VKELKKSKKFILVILAHTFLLKDPSPIFMPKFGLVDGRILEKTPREVVFKLLSAFTAFKRVKFMVASCFKTIIYKY